MDDESAVQLEQLSLLPTEEDWRARLLKALRDPVIMGRIEELLKASEGTRFLIRHSRLVAIPAACAHEMRVARLGRWMVGELCGQKP